MNLKKILAKLLNATEERTLLWTNPKPTTSLGATTVNLDLSKYKFIEITYTTYANQTKYNPPLRLEVPESGTVSGVMISFSGAGGYMTGNFVALSRTVSVTKTAVSFAAGVNAIPNNGQGYVTDHASTIPQKIYGIKSCSN